MPIITPKTARKHARRQTEQIAAGQLAKIRLHLEGYLQEGETPAQAVKRLLTELEAAKVALK